MDIYEATNKWIGTFQKISTETVEDLVNHGMDLEELTVPENDTDVAVYPRNNDLYFGRTGIFDTRSTLNGKYLVRMEDGMYLALSRSEIVPLFEHDLPSWGTMWIVSTDSDKKWMEDNDGEAIKAMTECGFRVYWSNKLGYFLGIDGGGYSFMEPHWIPLYKARGLQWHGKNAADPFAA